MNFSAKNPRPTQSPAPLATSVETDDQTDMILTKLK